MNRINFIKPIPFLRDREVRIWYWLVLVGGSFLGISIVIISGMQWYLYRTLYRQKLDIQNKLYQSDRIKTVHKEKQAEHDMIRNQLDNVNRYKTNPKNPYGILTTILNALKVVELNTVSIDKNRFELKVTASDARAISHCINQLHTQRAFDNVMLTSLQTHDGKIDAVIKGIIKTKLRV